MMHFHDTDGPNSPKIPFENKFQPPSPNLTCTWQKQLWFLGIDAHCETGVKPRNLCQQWFAASLVLFKDAFYFVSCNTDVKIAAVACVHQWYWACSSKGGKKVTFAVIKWSGNKAQADKDDCRFLHRVPQTSAITAAHSLGSFAQQNWWKEKVDKGCKSEIWEGPGLPVCAVLDKRDCEKPNSWDGIYSH